MASRKTLTVDNLVTLGTERLATMLVELAEDSPEIKRRLRLELAAAEGGEAIAAEIGKRIVALKTARSFVDWQKRREFVKDLDLQRAMIVDRLAPTRPDLAFDLMWRFMDLAEPVIERVDDSNGSVGDVFRSACDDLGVIAATARPDQTGLADRVFTAISTNDYGVFDGLVEGMLPAFAEVGAARLEARLVEALIERPDNADGRDWRASALRRALQAITDGRADVDAWIALIPPRDRASPGIGAAIGRRLLAAGRTKEALTALEAAKPKRHAARAHDRDGPFDIMDGGGDSDWEEVYIEALDADGQIGLAQQLRWAGFEQRLSATRLRAYLKRLPDFEDFEAERRALRHALGYRSFATALHFLHEWPDPAGAAQLVLARHAEIDGNLYYLLDSAARRIEGKHPLAATLLRRAMIEDTLSGAKSTRYKHAARHLLECRSLATSIADHAPFETHEAFVSRLRAKHGRKSGFWSLDAALTDARS